jgi:hypothetical protein
MVGRLVWEGFDIKGNFIQVAIHKHAGGRDIPSGTFKCDFETVML